MQLVEYKEHLKCLKDVPVHDYSNLIRLLDKGMAATLV